MTTARLIEPDPPHQRPTRFSHLVIQSPRFAEMTDWYKTVLRAKPLFENEVVCFLSYDDEHHRVMIGSNPNTTPRDPKAAGIVHFAFAFDTLDALLDTYLRLRDEGIAPANCVNHGFTTSFYYRDPDTNEVELAVDNFDDREEMNAWFATGAFDRNFVGVTVDPDALVRQRDAGVPPAEILQGSYE
jgi:catechol-2,3-dioxygenase